MRYRGGSRAAATSKMECFVIIINAWKPLTIITKHSILDVAAALDPPQRWLFKWGEFYVQRYFPESSVKRVLLKVSENSPEDNCAWASFLIKLQAFNAGIQSRYSMQLLSWYSTLISMIEPTFHLVL